MIKGKQESSEPFTKESDKELADLVAEQLAAATNIIPSKDDGGPGEEQFFEPEEIDEGDISSSLIAMAANEAPLVGSAFYGVGAIVMALASPWLMILFWPFGLLSAYGAYYFYREAKFSYKKGKKQMEIFVENEYKRRTHEINIDGTPK